MFYDCKTVWEPLFFPVPTCERLPPALALARGILSEGLQRSHGVPRRRGSPWRWEASRNGFAAMSRWRIAQWNGRWTTATTWAFVQSDLHWGWPSSHEVRWSGFASSLFAPPSRACGGRRQRRPSTSRSATDTRAWGLLPRQVPPVQGRNSSNRTWETGRSAVLRGPRRIRRRGPRSSTRLTRFCALEYAPLAVSLWAALDSNQRLPPCEDGTLTAELAARVALGKDRGIHRRNLKWHVLRFRGVTTRISPQLFPLQALIRRLGRPSPRHNRLPYQRRG